MKRKEGKRNLGELDLALLRLEELARLLKFLEKKNNKVTEKIYK